MSTINKAIRVEFRLCSNPHSIIDSFDEWFAWEANKNGLSPPLIAWGWMSAQ